MSKVAIKGNASGTGTFTLEAPNSNTDRTLVLPDEAGTVLTSASSINVTSLADVEEGTFTPVLYGTTTAGSVTGGNQLGRYTRIGNTATIWFAFQNVTMSGMAGGLRLNIDDLPAALKNVESTVDRYFGQIAFYNQNVPNNMYVISRLERNSGSPHIDFLAIADAGVWSGVDVDNGSPRYVEGTVTYALEGHGS